MYEGENHMQRKTKKSQLISTEINISKKDIQSWVSQILSIPAQQIKIQTFGSGAIYCRLLNHYFNNTIPTNRILLNPKNQYEFQLNMKQFQIALQRHKIKVNFQINKIVKQKFTENWLLIIQLYKIFDNVSPKFLVPISQQTSTTQLYQPKISNIKNQPFDLLQKIQIDHKNSNNISDKKSVSKGQMLWIIDRTKDILLSKKNNTQKLRQIKMLYNLNEVKIQQDQAAIIIYQCTPVRKKIS